MMTTGRKHDLWDEECTVAHMDDPRGCRPCKHCRERLRPAQWEEDCPGPDPEKDRIAEEQEAFFADIFGDGGEAA